MNMHFSFVYCCLEKELYLTWPHQDAETFVWLAHLQLGSALYPQPCRCCVHLSELVWRKQGDKKEKTFCYTWFNSIDWLLIIIISNIALKPTTTCAIAQLNVLWRHREKVNSTLYHWPIMISICWEGLSVALW